MKYHLDELYGLTGSINRLLDRRERKIAEIIELEARLNDKWNVVRYIDEKIEYEKSEYEKSEYDREDGVAE
jgi:hypothetical protein